MLPTGHQAYHSLCTSIPTSRLTVFISTMGPLRPFPIAQGGTEPLGAGRAHRGGHARAARASLTWGPAGLTLPRTAGLARQGLGTNQPLPLPAGLGRERRPQWATLLPMLIETVQLRIFKQLYIHRL